MAWVQSGQLKHDARVNQIRCFEMVDLPEERGGIHQRNAFPCDGHSRSGEVLFNDDFLNKPFAENLVLMEYMPVSLHKAYIILIPGQQRSC